MPILNHRFKEFFFHPIKANTLICLEFNQYPDNIDSYHLASIDSQHQQQPFRDTIRKISTNQKYLDLSSLNFTARPKAENQPNVSATGSALPQIKQQ